MVRERSVCGGEACGCEVKGGRLTNVCLPWAGAWVG